MVAYLKDTLLMCSWWPVSPEGGHLMRAWRRRSMRCVPERGASSNDQLLQTDSWPALLLWKDLKVSPKAAGTVRAKKPQSNHFLPFFLFCLCVWYLTLDILSCFSGCSTGTSVWGPSPSPLRSVVRTRAWKFDHLCSQSKAFLLMFHHRTSPTHLPRRWFPADFFFGLRLCAELRGPLADRALRKRRQWSPCAWTAVQRVPQKLLQLSPSQIHPPSWSAAVSGASTTWETPTKLWPRSQIRQILLRQHHPLLVKPE